MRGKSNVVLSRNKLNCFSCKKLVKISRIMKTKDKKMMCETCYKPSR